MVFSKNEKRWNSEYYKIYRLVPQNMKLYSDLLNLAIIILLKNINTKQQNISYVDDQIIKCRRGSYRGVALCS